MNIETIRFIDGKIMVDGKAYILEPSRQVAFCSHANSAWNKKFCFDANDLDCQDKYMIADTMRGNAVVYVERIEKLQEHEILNKGAYLPLKKLLREATPKEVKECIDNQPLSF